MAPISFVVRAKISDFPLSKYMQIFVMRQHLFFFVRCVMFMNIVHIKYLWYTSSQRGSPILFKSREKFRTLGGF